MGTFAVLSDNNIVENIIVAENKEIAETVTKCVCVEYFENDQPHIGLSYDPVNHIFEQPKFLDEIANDN